MRTDTRNPPIEYAPPKLGDWGNLRHLIEDSFPEITGSHLSYLIRNGMDKMFVARQGKQLLGFCYFEEISHDGLHLLWLATDRNHYQHGIASRLLKHLDSYALSNGYKSIALTVEKDNLAAKRLYEKLGYVLTDDRKAENKESWVKILTGECTEPAIEFGFRANNSYPFRVFKKILYRHLAN
ncbi:MAG: GNAT family N-acetyltransferase [Thiogranum sp.]